MEEVRSAELRNREPRASRAPVAERRRAGTPLVRRNDRRGQPGFAGEKGGRNSRPQSLLFSSDFPSLGSLPFDLDRETNQDFPFLTAPDAIHSLLSLGTLKRAHVSCQNGAGASYCERSNGGHSSRTHAWTRAPEIARRTSDSDADAPSGPGSPADRSLPAMRLSGCNARNRDDTRRGECRA